ncbi:amino acid ABC transporter ATP-binding protein [Falsiroseomonas sp. CW058]|uniref:amino acid ABC transporter ATP-binding protein n=1 Tax=Falsiroseomonas sp. CW058 TaxID=3388664 RepID=UPI003D31966A
MEGVRKSYGPHTVLPGLDLSVARGERVVVCGPSGSGKSTAIACINGLVPHDAGRIVVDGIELDHRRGTAPEIRRRVGMVFQSFNLFPHLTALENCTIGPVTVQRRDRREAEAEAMALLERVRIPDQAGKYPAQLSGGQQQRVAIARALAMRPRVMLFDEPTSALDPEMVKEVLDAMVALADTGITMVVVTHEMGFAREVAHRILFMDRGEVLQDSPPAEFFARPAGARMREFLDHVRRGEGRG